MKVNYVEEISKLDQQKVYSTYYGKEIRFRKNYLSPFRIESDPSFGIYKKNGKVLWKDFGGEGGDVISFVMKHEKLNFVSACKLIISDFNINISTNGNRKQQVSEVFNFKQKRMEEKEEYMDIVPLLEAKDKVKHYDYMYQFDIGNELVKQQNILFLRCYHIIYYDHKKQYKRHVEVVIDDDDLCYYIPYENNMSVHYNKCKIYTPGKKPKMIGNTKKEDIYYAFKASDNTIHYYQTCYITAGHKDALALYAILENMYFFKKESPESITICCLNSESCLIWPSGYQRYIIVYDNDQAGYEFSKKLGGLIEDSGVKDVWVIGWDGVFKNGGIAINSDKANDVSDVVKALKKQKERNGTSKHPYHVLFNSDSLKRIEELT